MNKCTLITAMLLLAAYFGFAEEQSISTIRISPEDVVQTSIQQFQFSSNSFAVRWTYTEAGAKKALAFWEAHDGQKISTAIGDFNSPPSEHIFRAMPPTFTTYDQWKEGWLKHRMDKIFVRSEADAQKILVGLKSK
jgi:hypothetical protein